MIIGKRETLKNSIQTSCDMKFPYLQAIAAIIVFSFYSGLDKYILNNATESSRLDWLEQLYYFAAMVALGLCNPRITWKHVFLILTDMLLVLFNTNSRFVNRINAAFWIGVSGGCYSKKWIYLAVKIGVLVGAFSVIVESLGIAIADQPWTRTPSGLYSNPSFAIIGILSLPIIYRDKYAAEITSLILAATFLSGARVSIFLGILTIPFYLRWISLKSFAISAAIVLAIFMSPNSNNLGVIAKLESYKIEYGAIKNTIACQQSKADDVCNISGAKTTSGSLRVQGLFILEREGARLFFPLASVRPNEIGHIGLLLYLSVYGLVLGLVYALLGMSLLPISVGIYMLYLSLFFTQPIMSFGVGFLVLIYFYKYSD